MSDSELFARLNSEFLDSILNDYGRENFDEYRFGKFEKRSVKSKLQGWLRKKAIPAKELTALKHSYDYYVSKYGDDLNCIYKNLDEQSRWLLVKVIAFRALGYRRVKLPLNDRWYWDSFERVKRLKDPNDKIDPHFLHFVLETFDLRGLGYDIKL